MRNSVSVWIIIAVAVLGLLFFHLLASGQQQPAGTAFQDEPEAHALYDSMVEAMRKAETLSYRSDYRWESKGREIGHCTYTIWMKKPNYFRVETVTGKGEKGGILIGDGNNLWIYWPNDRPWFSTEDRNDYEKTRSNVYMKEPTPVGKHSIAHKTSLLGAGMGMTIIDPSTFHGYTDSLQPYIDGVRSMGTETIGTEVCDAIEVSIMKGQRSWYLWLSKRDNLPRKLRQVVRVSYDIITEELWSGVIINAEIPTENFAWKPPEGWQQWHLPDPEEMLLKAGQEAPDFDLLSIDGGKIKLSDYRGKVVWLNFWRVGCPPCREEMPYLEELYRKYRDKGLVILGFNCSDDKQITLDFLRKYSATFPNVLDSSEAAIKTAFEDYNITGVPVNYIIDREGKIADAWYGYTKGEKRGAEALESLEVK